MESFKLIYFTVHQDLKYHFLPKQIMRRISVTTKNKKTSVPETQYFSIIQDFCSLPLSRVIWSLPLAALLRTSQILLKIKKCQMIFLNTYKIMCEVAKPLICKQSENCMRFVINKRIKPSVTQVNPKIID